MSARVSARVRGGKRVFVNTKGATRSSELRRMRRGNRGEGGGGGEEEEERRNRSNGMDVPEG